MDNANAIKGSSNGQGGEARRAHECVRQLLLQDAQAVVAELSVLEGVNTAAALRLRDLLPHAEELAPQQCEQQQQQQQQQQHHAAATAATAALLCETEARVAHLETVAAQLEARAREVAVRCVAGAARGARGNGAGGAGA